MALAIELAAARFPVARARRARGRAGRPAAAAHRRPRIDDRHRSLRSTLDWSYELLDEPDRAVLRRVSVFAGPFTAAAAAAVLADWPPVPAGRRVRRTWPGWPTRACWSRSPGRAGPGTGPWRRSASTASIGSRTPASRPRRWPRHLRWCLAETADSPPRRTRADRRLAGGFDAVADELRAALRLGGRDRSSTAPTRTGWRLDLAGLTFTRGMPGESQRRYEQAAGLAAGRPGHRRRPAQRRRCRRVAPRRRRRAAAAPVRRPTRRCARGIAPARRGDLARNAELINRGPGLMATAPAAGAAEALIAEGWSLAGDDPAAQARLLTAEAFNGATADPATIELIEQAIALAREHRRPADRERGARPAHRRPAGAGRGPRRGGQRVAAHRAAGADAGDGRRRDGVLRRLDHGRRVRGRRRRPAGRAPAGRATAGPAVPPGGGPPGHRAAARRHGAGRRLARGRRSGRALPRGVGAGRPAARGQSEPRPRTRSRRSTDCAGTTTPGRRGWTSSTPSRRPGARSRWCTSASSSTRCSCCTAVCRSGRCRCWTRRRSSSPSGTTACGVPGTPRCGPRRRCLSGHRGGRRPGRTGPGRWWRATRSPPPSSTAPRPWPDKPADRDGLTAAAAALEEAGCRYQWARTLVLIGGEHRARGESMLAAMGATAMAGPPE